MSTKRPAAQFLSYFVVGSLLYGAMASAEGVRRNRATSERPGVSLEREPSTRPGASLERVPRAGNRPPGNRDSSRPPRVPNWSELGNNWQNLADTLGRGFRNNRNNNHREDGYHGYNSDREMAKAYRDVGIANAIASVIGALVMADVNARHSQPAGGRYERQRVVLKEGYYEEYRVFVPEVSDPRTREVIRGHYEDHRRWVPEVYGYQDVWVPDYPR